MIIRPWKSIPLRLGLIGVGLVLLQTASILWILAESFLRPEALVISGIAWIFGMTCFVLAMMTSIPPRAGWLILVGLVASLWGAALVEMLNNSTLVPPHAADEMIGEYSAEAFGRGINPYAWDYSDITRVYRDQGRDVAIYLDGSSQRRLNYPALPTLTLVALGPVGLGKARNVSLIFHTVLLILLFIGSPLRLRPMVLLPLFALRSFGSLTLSGNQDIVWSTLLVAMVLVWQRPTLRAVLFGLACAYRQQPWLVAPFLLICIWNESAEGREVEAAGPNSTIHNSHRRRRSALADPRLRAISYFTAVSLGIFLLVNLPFSLWDFRAWVLGVFEPVYAPFNVYSQGLGALSQYNLLSFPRVFYTGLQWSALVIMLVVHWRHPRWVGRAFWMFPGIFFWLYYRGLANYWLYWIPPLLMALVRNRWQAPVSPEDHPRWHWTAAFFAAVVAANLVWGVVMLRRQPSLTATLSFPMESQNERSVSRLGLIVTNTSDRVLRARFSVQHDGLQPLPWNIETGPERLIPGESGQYLISNFSAGRDFAVARGAQVVITDESNDYRLRAVIDVPGDQTFASPDRIINPSFSFWSPAWGSPAGWSWFTSDGPTFQPRLDRIDGRTALVFPAQNGIGLLSQTVTFPDSFSIWVRPVTLPSGSAEEVYGMQFDESEHRLRVLFGDREGNEQLEENVAVVYVRAPLDRWSRQEIDPAGLYALFGWALPPYSIRSQQGLEFAARQVTLRLIVSGTHVSHAFGPIEQDPDFASGHTLVEEAIAHPDDYYVNMGDEYCRQRNADLAHEAYLRALDYNPDNTLAQGRLGSCQ